MEDGEALPVPLSRSMTPVVWQAVDVLLAFFLAAGSIAGLLSHGRRVGGPTGASEVVQLIAIGAACLALPFRRRRPAVVLGVAVVADAVLIGLGSRDATHIIPGLAMYTLAAQAETRLPLSWVAAAVVPLVAGSLADVGSRTAETTLVFAPALLLLGWLAGENTRARRGYAAGLAERAAERERERSRRAEAEERARIARELHDVVAHAMTVVAVRSGVARMVADTRPEEAVEALGIIETASRRGLAELRRIVGVLRQADGPDELAPAPGLADLPGLVEEVGQAGVTVELLVEGAPVPLPPGEDLSAYRIAQEALTNVVRHAAPATARLSVRYRPDAVEIECLDDGGGRMNGTAATAPVAGGHGIVGMRERVALYGGELSAAPSGSGFRVLARLPVSGEDS